MSRSSSREPNDDSDRDRQLETVIADYIRACENGPAPDRREILKRYPKLADELRQFFVQRDRMNQIAEPIREFNDALANAVGPGQRLSYVGDYELLEEIARGGMGVVYKARQTMLGRIVAVKMIVSGRLASEQDVQRFQVEAQAAAGLQHPNIVSIHEVGQHEGWHYFSMDYVEGRDLSAILRENLLPSIQAATYVRQMAEAIHYAHQQGILHRDLKPSNILIDNHDQVRITDFGLAMRVEGGNDLTCTGQIVGTPSYMPPEQALSKREQVAVGADVYALGAVLYECLTGRPPFRADTVVETLRQVVHEETAAPRLLNPTTPSDLETICLKCLEKEPHKRYGTAQFLADDLGRFLRGEPIVARPIGRPARLWRWCRRNPVVAGLGGVASLALATALTALLVSHFLVTAALDDRTKALSDLTSANAKLATEEQNVRDALNGKTQALNDLQKSNQDLKDTIDREQEANYFNHVLLAWREWQAGHFGAAEKHLAACREDLRSWEWHYIARLCRPAAPLAALEQVHGLGDMYDGMSPPGLCTSLDGSRLAYLLTSRTVVVLDTANAKELRRIDAPHEVTCVALNPSGELLAGIGAGRLSTWETATGEKRLQQNELHTAFNRVEFSLDSQHLVVSEQTFRGVTRDEMLRRWGAQGMTILNGESGEPEVNFGYGTPRPGRCIHSADAKQFATLHARNCKIYRLDGDKTVDLPEHDAMLAGGEFSFDGTRLATFDIESNIAVWDTASGALISRWDAKPESIDRICFSPDGSTLATLSFLSNVKVWETAGGALAFAFRESEVERTRINSTPSTASMGPFSVHRYFAFSPDGTKLASASGDQKMTIWDLVSWRETTLRTREPIRFVRFLGGASHVLCYATREKTTPDTKLNSPPAVNLEQWHLRGGEESRLIFRPGPFYHTVAVDNAGKRVASIVRPVRGRLNTIKLWNMQSGDELASVPWESGGELSGLAFSPNDSLLAITGNSGVGILDLATNELRSPLEKQLGRSHRVTFSKDGKRILVAHASAGIYDLESGRELIAFDRPNWCASAVWNEDESKVATGGRYAGVFVWNVETGKQLLELSSAEAAKDAAEKRCVYCVDFSPDGESLAAADDLGRLFVWNTHSGKRVLEWQAHAGRAYTVAYSPDGKRIISMGDDGVLRVWESKTGKEILTLTGHSDRVYSATFTRDGSRIVSTSADGTIRIWDGTPLIDPLAIK